MTRVLVIRHGAFGDIVLAFAGFAAIRAHHPRAHITLMTTRPFAAMMAQAPWFDEVLIDDKPDWWNLAGVWRLRGKLRGFDMVYDLQNSGRSCRYFALAGRPVWSGTAKGCALRDTNPARMTLHARERMEAQLAQAGMALPLPAPDLGWLSGDVSDLELPTGYMVLVPGAAPHRPEKRWPVDHFKALAAGLNRPFVVVGSRAEAGLGAEIGGINLAGRTDFFQLADVLRGAACAVGNDTGPMHLAAALGTPCVSLFSNASDPAYSAPRYPDGGWPRILRAPHLAGLAVAQVREALP